MGKGRAPCCDKTKVKKGPWSAAEDLKLCAFIQKYGHSNWRSLPKEAGLLRCGKSCRLRWINYLRPDVKRGNFTPVEEQTIINLHSSIGNKWSKIASYLPGRTDNEIKNVWNTHLKKRLMTKKTEAGDRKISYSANSPSFASSSVTASEDQKLETNEVNGVQESEAKDPKEKPELLLKEISTSHPSNNDHHVTKEFPASDSPASSHASNFSNPICQDNMPSKGLELFVSNDVTNINPGPGNCAADVNVEHEIALDSDPDFWELLDSLDPLQVYKSEQNGENQGPFDLSNPGEKFDSEIEWLRSLERELGLTSDTDFQPKDQEIMSTLEPEMCPGLEFFPTWPSSPYNLGI